MNTELRLYVSRFEASYILAALNCERISLRAASLRRFRKDARNERLRRAGEVDDLFRNLMEQLAKQTGGGGT